MQPNYDQIYDVLDYLESIDDCFCIAFNLLNKTRAIEQNSNNYINCSFSHWISDGNGAFELWGRDYHGDYNNEVHYYINLEDLTKNFDHWCIGKQLYIKDLKEVQKLKDKKEVDLQIAEYKRKIKYLEGQIDNKR